MRQLFQSKTTMNPHKRLTHQTKEGINAANDLAEFESKGKSIKSLILRKLGWKNGASMVFRSMACVRKHRRKKVGLIKAEQIKEGEGDVDVEIKQECASEDTTKFEALKIYGCDLLDEKAHKSNFHRAIGRDKEIEEVILILMTMTANNAVLVVEPGVGKADVVEGLAQRIASGFVPECLADVRLISLDVPRALAAEANCRGAFEERLKAVLKEVEKAQGKVILFIDEIHLMFGEGCTEQSMDAANLLHHMLAWSQLRCIGATTFEEYKQYVENTFKKRFQPVYVIEPSVVDTISILRGLKEEYEGYHGVSIQDQALVMAAELSVRYITGRNLPDKAIALVGEACANVGVRHSQPEEIDNRDRNRMQLETELHALNKKKDKASEARLVEVRKELDDLRDRLQSLIVEYKLCPLKQRIEELSLPVQEAERRYDLARSENLRYGEIREVKTVIAKHKSSTDGTQTVGPKQIREVLSRWTGIPATQLGRNYETDSLTGLADRLHQRVVGQDLAIEAVAKAILRSKAGLGRPKNPIWSFLFLGPTGVGKTELAKAMTEQLFDNKNLLVRIHMSEYMQEDSVARLVGANHKGCVGHKKVGQLTEVVRRQPYSVVLFEEVEKAHIAVLNTLLSVLDAGWLRDGLGRTIDFRNTVIIMTSNLGAEHLLSGDVGNSTMEAAHKGVMHEVRRHFRPKVLNNLDEIIIFDPLSHEQIRQVARLQLKDISTSLAKKGISLAVTNAALDYVIAESYDPLSGARPIRRWLEMNVINKLSKMAPEEGTEENSTVYVDAVMDDLTYNVGKNGGMLDPLWQKAELLIELPPSTNE